MIGMSARHLNHTCFSLAARKVGMGDGQLLEVEMTPEREVEGVMVFDVNGHLLYVNRCLQASHDDAQSH